MIIIVPSHQGTRHIIRPRVAGRSLLLLLLIAGLLTNI
jgi:hypothetical protein